MNIEILNGQVTTVPTAKGSYQVLELAFKNLDSGKVEGKKLMSFGANAGAFKTLAAATTGQQFSVTATKNDKGYYDWTSVGPVGTPSPAPARSEGAQAASPRTGNWETPDERAQRQVFIIRQSSLTNAIAVLSVGAKAVKKDEVFALASEMADWVLGKQPNATGFDDMQDDIPL